MRTKLRVGAIIFRKEKILTTLMEKDGYSYHVLPGGGVEEKESIYEALKREVKEETNIEITKFRLVYLRELNMESGDRGVEFYFYVEDYEGKPKRGYDPEEKDSSLKKICYLDPKKLDKIEFHPKQLISNIKEDRKHNFNNFKHLGLHNYP